jgi:chaperonin GroEL
MEQIITSNNILINDFKLLDEGFIKACEAVAVTYSAEGKFSLVDNNNEPPFLTKDGANTLERIRFANPTMNYGALLAIQGAASTLKKAADGTSSTSILQMNYLKNLNRKHFNKGVERGIKKAVDEVYKHIADLSVTATREDLLKIAITSCNNNVEMGELIMKAYDFADAVELVKNDNREHAIVLEQSGMILDSGFSSVFFCNSNKLNYEAKDCAVLCVASWKKDPEIISYIKSFYKSNGMKFPMLVVTERENNELRDNLIEFKKIGINIAHVGLTAYSEFDNVTLLSDIAKLTGASVFNPGSTEEIVLGFADKIVARDANTTITVSKVPDAITDLIQDLENQENKDNKLEVRLKRLKGKAALIEVGGLTPGSLREAYDSFEDGLASVRTTKENGYVAGGGSTLLFISTILNTKMKNKEEQRGYDLVKKTIKSPFNQLLKNSNRKSSFFGTDYEKKCSIQYGVSYDAKKDEICNLFQSGVIDSTKAIKTALESATNVAINMYSIGVIIHFPKM